jgi:hypothetical protein
MKRVEALERVKRCPGRPQQVRAAVNEMVRRHMLEVAEVRRPSSLDAWASIEREGRELGRWLSEQMGEAFNESMPQKTIQIIRQTINCRSNGIT